MSASLKVGRTLHPLSHVDASFPQLGAWSAFCTVVGTTPDVGSRATLIIDDKQWVCTVVGRSQDVGRGRVTLVGGMGGMTSVPTTARSLDTGLSVRSITTQLLQIAGETLSTGSDSSTLNARTRTWQLTQGDRVGVQLRRLLENWDAVWRYDSDGTVLIAKTTLRGTITPPTSWLLQDGAPSDGTVTFAVAGPLSYLPSPGDRLDGTAMDEIGLRVTPEGTHVTLYPMSRKQLLENAALLSRTHGGRFTTSYVCTVKGQNGNGTLQLMPDDSTIRGSGLDQVPIRYGLPGISVTVEAGHKCTVSYDSEDPGQPYVSHFFAENGSGFLTTMGPTGDAQFVALANLVKDELDAIKVDLDGIKSTFDSHTHLVNTTGTAAAQSGTAQAPLSPAPTPHTPGEVACTLLKTS